MKIALLLIAHGSRRPEANADLVAVADQLRQSGQYPIVETAYLELAEPTIPAGAARCVEAGATEVRLLPYFLSMGRHVAEDLANDRDRFSSRWPQVTFRLCPPLGLHPGLIDVLLERAEQNVPAASSVDPRSESPRGPGNGN